MWPGIWRFLEQLKAYPKLEWVQGLEFPWGNVPGLSLPYRLAPLVRCNLLHDGGKGQFFQALVTFYGTGYQSAHIPDRGGLVLLRVEHLAQSAQPTHLDPDGLAMGEHTCCACQLQGKTRVIFQGVQKPDALGLGVVAAAMGRFSFGDMQLF